MKLLFAGTPQVAVTALEALLAQGQHQVVGVLTRPDAPQGRKRVLTPSPVASRAQELGLPVIKASSWSPQLAQEIQGLGAEAAAVVAFGVLLPQEALDLLPAGWINLHFSALPAWRGAAPVQRALMAGEEEIFSTTFRIDQGLDTGPTYRQESTPVAGLDSAGDILQRLATSGGALLSATFDDIAAGTQPRPQTGESSLAPKLTIQDGHLDFNQPAAQILAQVRGVTPEPGAWALYKETRFKLGMLAATETQPQGEPGQVFMAGKKVLVTCADAALELTSVQPAGKKMMEASAWARGASQDLSNGKVILQ